MQMTAGGTRRVPILMYHSIAHEASRRFRPFVVAPERFAAQLAYLAAADYTPLTVSALVAARANGGARLPARPVVITFDDGFADFYTAALPALARHGFPATLYVTTGTIGGTSRWLAPEGEGDRPMLTWEQLAAVHAAGIECGGHTHTHPALDAIPLADAQDEIARCRAILGEALGAPVTSFAYPFGYYNAAVRRLVRAAGYTSACAVNYGMSAPADDPLALTRQIVTADTTLDGFAALMEGRTRAEQVYLRLRSRLWHGLRRGAAPWMSRPRERMST